MRSTGYKDKDGVEIFEGNYVSLAGYMTADDSMGVLPNGWHFDEEDVYKVVWSENPEGWTLDIPHTKPDSAYNCKYLNHARSLLVDGDVKIVEV